MQNHLLQSHEWEKYAQLEDHQTFWLEGKDYQALALKHHTPLGNYLYCPYGPTIDTSDPVTALEHSLTALKIIAREEHAFFIRIEPTVPIDASSLANHGLVKSHDLDPAHTWALDLTQPQDQILAAIEKNKVRSWRNYQKKGLRIRTTTNPEQITILTNFLKQLGSHNHFIPQEENHLKNQLKSGFATLYIAELEGAPIAATLVYDYAGTRYYAHAATDGVHQKYAAGPILSIQTIIDAKNNGAKTYDFWGITTSEDHNHPWYGFTQYKKSFGGYQIDYAGTWDLPLQKQRYRAYQLIRQMNRLLRRSKIRA